MTQALIFGKYEIIRRLAIGGMGEIFLARQVGFDRLVILKSLRPELAEDQRGIEEFLDEARVAAKLNHPNIVAVYEVGAWEGVYFIAMEYIEGDSIVALMQGVVRAKTKVPFPLIAKIGADAARGLDHAHNATTTDGTPLNIIHRDISPQNIMVRTDGVTKVVDFGIAHAAIRESRTATGVLKGKIKYMAPEQLRGEALDARTDQFSLGVVLWEMCTRRRMVGKVENISQLYKMVTQEIHRPSEVMKESLPAELDDTIFRMLSKNKADRFPRCADVADAFERYLKNQENTVSEADVGVFVRRIVGGQVKKRTENLSPSHENFFISLRAEPAPSPGVEHTDTQGVSKEVPIEAPAPKPQRMRGPLPLALVGIAIMLAGALTFVFAQRAGIDDEISVPKGGTGQSSATTETSRPDARVVEPPKVETAEVGPPVLSLQSEPPGAMVKSGDLVLGKTPLVIKTLAANEVHRLALSLKGYEPSATEVRLDPGEEKELVVPLVEKPRPKEHRVGKPRPRRERTKPSSEAVATKAEDGALTLNTEPWVMVYSNGRSLGSTPLFEVKLKPGTHTLRLVNEKIHLDITRKVTIKAGETSRLSWNLR